MIDNVNCNTKFWVSQVFMHEINCKIVLPVYERVNLAPMVLSTGLMKDSVLWLQVQCFVSDGLTSSVMYILHVRPNPIEGP